MNIFIETYGCSANQSNSEIMGGLLVKAGYRLSSEEDADLLIINTCTVKTQTERKIIRRLEKLRYSSKKILVAGCMSEVQKEMIEEVHPDVSIIGVNEMRDISETVRRIENGEQVIMVGSKPTSMVCLPKVRINPVINIAQISTGCLGDCAYCIVRSAKGALRSFPVHSIVDDVKKSVTDGCKEIWLTSQDCGCYGFDTGVKLPALLRKVTAIEGNFRIRIGMMNPDHIKSIQGDLITALINKKMYRFVHMPVQSGSDEVLKAMGRRYTSAGAGEIIDDFTGGLPNFTFSTDIIVGFPGETDEQFQESVEFVKKYKPDIVNISRYGKRPMTRASEMEQVDGNIIKMRAKTLTDVVCDVALEKNKRWVGWKGEVLLSKVGEKGGFIGRNFAYKPIVVDYGELGTTVEVEVVEAMNGYLIGKIC